ncbi:MAG: hypothetical protein WBQ17_02880 [Rhizomicrobium sp.]
MIVVAVAFALGLASADGAHPLAAATPASPTKLATSAAHQNPPRMQLQAQYAGPLRDTVVQRWRDPVDGTVCYMYLPIVVQHSPPTPTGFVQYGANTIGSISCIPGH